ncbi:MAG: hypothetical protein GEU73_02720 [Chloroflexi bacterium]|nr:hypothetical protein [Chloroflexota bacterium]
MAERARLEARFDALFATRTGYLALDDRIALTQAKKPGLLLVLVHPELPLHNNPAELAPRASGRGALADEQCIGCSGSSQPTRSAQIRRNENAPSLTLPPPQYYISTSLECVAGRNRIDHPGANRGGCFLDVLGGAIASRGSWVLVAIPLAVSECMAAARYLRTPEGWTVDVV